MENNKEIFLKGIENLSAIGKKEQLGITTSIKILVFYIILCILAEYQNSGKKLFLMVSRVCLYRKARRNAGFFLCPKTKREDK